MENIMDTWTFPFAVTQGMEDAFLEHAAFCSAGQDWLYRNDPEGHQEQVFLENIAETIREAAKQHFGEDEDAYLEFEKVYELDETITGLWWDILQNSFLEEAA